MATVLLVDGHSLAYRAFYALPVDNFATTTGQPTNAVYGFTSMLINVLRDEQPDRVAVAFDVSRKTFRTAEYPEYKANRAKSPAEFTGQVGLIQDVLRALGITVLEVDGFEADDIIATLTQRAQSEHDDVRILTGDRDTFQLVNDDVTVLYPRKGVSDLARMTPEAVREKYGLDPDQYPDFAALRGDPSDNLPGIPGVGEKTATKWITEFGSLAALVDRVDEVKGKAGEALRAALPQVLVNRHLTELRRDVPLEVDLAALDRRPWDIAEVDAVFEVLQFRALRERLLAANVGGETPVVVDDAVVVEVEAVDDADVAAYLAGLAGPVAVAVRGTWGRGAGELDAIGVRDSGGRIGVIACTPPSARAAVAAWLADPAVDKQMHDAKGPALALLASGSALGGVTMDTALAAYLATPGLRSYALDAVAERTIGRVLAPAADTGQLAFEAEESNAALGAEADAIAALAEHLGRRLEADGEAELLTGMELPLTLLLARMEHTGIAVDLDALHTLSSEFGSDMRRAEEQAHVLAGRAFNLGSPKQLQEILFDVRKLPKTKKIKTGHTTDAEALQTLFAQTGDPLLEQLLAWRDRSKLRQTVDGLIPLVDADGRIHTTFNQTVAATGRLSSADPNLQNIPVRTEAGRRIRETFVVGSGYEALMTADYSQIEMRIMAHVSADTGLIEAFASGEDLHTTVASRVFGVEPSAVDPEMRRRIKAMSYGLAYGLSAFGLAQQLGIGPDEARRLMDEYFNRFGGVRDYLASVVDEARKTGYTETMFGRRRYLPDLSSDNRQRREMAERMALNAPIQGTAADVMKIAMLKVQAGIEAKGLRSRMLLQVHDELVLEIAPGEHEVLEQVVRTGMGEAADLSVALDVSVGVGRSWHEAAHV